VVEDVIQALETLRQARNNAPIVEPPWWTGKRVNQSQEAAPLAGYNLSMEPNIGTAAPARVAEARAAGLTISAAPDRTYYSSAARPFANQPLVSLDEGRGGRPSADGQVRYFPVAVVNEVQAQDVRLTVVDGRAVALTYTDDRGVAALGFGPSAYQGRWRIVAVRLDERAAVPVLKYVFGAAAAEAAQPPVLATISGSGAARSESFAALLERVGAAPAPVAAETFAVPRPEPAPAARSLTWDLPIEDD
jgi:hypothetical protein